LDFLSTSIIWRSLIGLLFYTIIVSIYYLLIYYTNFREKLQQESELNALVKEAELRSLKYQINPHFIFNSLNSISSLTISDPDKAREMTINLSTFLRGTLSKNEKQKTKLSEELDNVRLYLKIERVRFEGKFELTEELSDECLNMEVPNMILQPLFENAIKHGVYESLNLVKINLSCKREGDYLKITVANNYDKDAAPRKGEGIGLKNIRNRLQLIYNQDNLLRVNKADGKFSVDIFIPLGEK
jgi:LytS/YehU family sensor histidine kinase